MSSSGSLRFASVTRLLERMHGALVEKIGEHADKNHKRIDAWAYMPASEHATLASYATGYAHSAVSLALEIGREEGRAQMRAELGLPPEGTAGPDDDTRRLAPCPVDQRLCPVPAARRRVSCR